MNFKVIIGIVLVTVIIIGGGIWLTTRTTPPSTKYDDFAKCIASKQITMYGAYWCPHCKDQKALFGDSFQYVPYVECTVETKKCLDKKIDGYPTWLTPDGKTLSGTISLQKLAEFSSCTLPK
jgi:hypothetical protein